MVRLGNRLITGMSVALLSTGAVAGAAEAACGSQTLGVSRTITIDTAGGKLYGGLQYDPSNLLRDGEVILTFDDGPLRRYTRKVLKALASHCTKATFFMVGRMAVADPAMVREVANSGHTIANHTWSHKNLQKRSARRAGGEIELGISAVRIAAKAPISPFFRFPYLADPNAMIAYGKSRNLAIFSIDIDSYDYKTKSRARLFQHHEAAALAAQRHHVVPRHSAIVGRCHATCARHDAARGLQDRACGVQNTCRDPHRFR